MVYKFFDKKSLGETVVNKIMSNKELAERVHNSIVKKHERKKVNPFFIDNIWGTDLADMELISKFNQGFRFPLRFIDICSKYAWVLPLKDKKRITITNAFQKKFNESKCKPNKIWIDKGGEFYNRSMKSFLAELWYKNVFNA